MRVVGIIQARMGSTRLPGKVLSDLGGQTALARVIRRVRRARALDDVIVATSESAADLAIVDQCRRLSTACFRGSEDDVLDRYYCAAKEVEATAVVRITADCPLIAPEIIEETAAAFLNEQPDYASNALVPGYPRGLDVEVFTMEALSRTWQHARLPYERVHVTPYMYEVPGRFRVLSVAAKADYSHYRWTLDTSEDLSMIRTVYEHFGSNDLFGWRDVLALMQQEPQLAEINMHVRQKAVHEG